ncbi:MAG: hypothetical protein K9N49_10430 [Candidatus Marinimicrobia bacterium]|nr:hypothetical protein [Candidatus Neomarinimicrobiota bacterium]
MAWAQSNFAARVVAFTGATYGWADPVSDAYYTNTLVTLGRPTVDTTGDGWDIEDPVVPVNPLYPAWRAHEVVTIAAGGELILEMEETVWDHPDNPHGLDFTVFGNARQSGPTWRNGDPALTNFGAGTFAEQARVAVSQDGETWHTFTNGPFADDFAPTLGRIYDPAQPDASLGAWNQWWGAPTDPALPLDPAITAADFNGQTVAQVCRWYGRSAGGTSFDLAALEELPADPETGRKWFRYVRLIQPAGDAEAEIDAVAAVAPVPPFVRWQIKHFDWRERADPAIAGPLASPAQDGWSNVQKYLTGLDPWEPAEHAFDLRLELSANGREVIFERQAAADDLALAVQWTANPADWIAAGAVTDWLTEDLGDGRVRVRAALPDEAAACFVRLVLLDTP